MDVTSLVVYVLFHFGVAPTALLSTDVVYHTFSLLGEMEVFDFHTSYLHCYHFDCAGTIPLRTLRVLAMGLLVWSLHVILFWAKYVELG